MKGKRKNKGFIYILLSLILLVATILGGRIILPAYAAPPAFTSVLTDLQKDSNFNVADYPAAASNTSIQVIQIAESSDGELLIYTYQPCQTTRKIFATSINMSLSDTAENSRLYNLTFLSSEHTLCKYKVFGLTVSSDDVRYYNITSIYRNYISGVDGVAGNGNTVSEVAFPVGQLWTAGTVGDTVIYSMTYTEVVEVKEKFVGFIDYCDGVSVDIPTVTVSGSHTLRNFVAFSTEYPIDRLIEAELRYSVDGITFKQCANILCLNHEMNATYGYTANGQPRYEIKTLHADNKSSNNYNGGLKGNKYEWNDIQTTEEFIKNVSTDSNSTLKVDSEQGLQGTQWVLNFYNVVLSGKGSAFFDGHLTWTGESVSDVTILRLKFERDGKVYNLGVTDNKQTGDNSPINERKDFNLWQWLEEKTGVPAWIWKLIIVLLPIIIILSVLAIIFPPVGKALLWLITSPFRLIALIFQKISERKEAAPAKATPSKSSKTKAPKAKSTKPRSKSTRTKSKRK